MSHWAGLEAFFGIEINTVLGKSDMGFELRRDRSSGPQEGSCDDAFHLKGIQKAWKLDPDTNCKQEVKTGLSFAAVVIREVSGGSTF